MHLVGWSTAGAAIALVARARRVASLTFLDPVSPYGFGGVFRDGRPCWPDVAGSGAGVANPEFVQRLRDGDRSEDSPLSPRNVMNATYWRAGHREPPAREDILLDEILLTTLSFYEYLQIKNLSLPALPRIKSLRDARSIWTACHDPSSATVPVTYAVRNSYSPP